MVILSAGVAGLRREDAETEEAKTYALLLADTVLVKEGGAPPELLTSACPKAWTEVAYYLKVCPPLAAWEGVILFRPGCDRGKAWHRGWDLQSLMFILLSFQHSQFQA
jgi:hypothetical protein